VGRGGAAIIFLELEPAARLGLYRLLGLVCLGFGLVLVGG